MPSNESPDRLFPEALLRNPRRVSAKTNWTCGNQLHRRMCLPPMIGGKPMKPNSTLIKGGKPVFVFLTTRSVPYSNSCPWPSAMTSIFASAPLSGIPPIGNWRRGAGGRRVHAGSKLKHLTGLLHQTSVFTTIIRPEAQASLVHTKPLRFSKFSIKAGTFGAWPSGQLGCGRRSSMK